jgi:hypothetical protein
VGIKRFLGIKAKIIPKILNLFRTSMADLEKLYLAELGN